MTDQLTSKKILIVDDLFANAIKIGFESELSDSPYPFVLDIAETIDECLRQLEQKDYDVIILDVRMDHKSASKGGLDINLGLALREHFGPERPIRIIVTAYATFPDCVSAMRHGAWDFLAKNDGKTFYRTLVDSVISGLQRLDLRAEQHEQIARKWIPHNFPKLQEEYGGELVALWHIPEVRCVAHAPQAFELEARLKEWRSQPERAIWEEPYIVSIPPRDTEDL